MMAQHEVACWRSAQLLPFFAVSCGHKGRCPESAISAMGASCALQTATLPIHLKSSSVCSRYPRMDGEYCWRLCLLHCSVKSWLHRRLHRQSSIQT